MLKVNEVFGPTIQGEGRSVGKEVVFLRLANCNLHCIYCDTPYTWNWESKGFAHPEKYDPQKEVRALSDGLILETIKILGHRTKALVVSGGEPLLQQKALVSLLRSLKGEGYWVEVETNGTVTPTPEIVRVVDRFNCSPKLANSGEPANRRQKPKAIDTLISTHKVDFKFVVSSEANIQEVLDFAKEYGPQSVFLMPEGRTPDELAKRREVVKNLCLRHGFSFSDRLHVVQFGGVRGV